MRYSIEQMLAIINQELAEAGEQSINEKQLAIITRRATPVMRSTMASSMNATQNAHNTPRFQRGGNNGR